MVGVVFNVLIVFGTLFGIVYLIIASRTRIRMALIEKGADASIFQTKPKGTSHAVSIVLVNLALLLFFIGVSIFVAAGLHNGLNIDSEIAFPGSIFTFAGVGLFIGYLVTNRIIKKESKEQSSQ